LNNLTHIRERGTLNTKWGADGIGVPARLACSYNKSNNHITSHENKDNDDDNGDDDNGDDDNGDDDNGDDDDNDNCDTGNNTCDDNDNDDVDNDNGDGDDYIMLIKIEWWYKWLHTGDDNSFVDNIMMVSIIFNDNRNENLIYIFFSYHFNNDKLFNL